MLKPLKIVLDPTRQDAQRAALGHGIFVQILENSRSTLNPFMIGEMQCDARTVDLLQNILDRSDH